MVLLYFPVSLRNMEDCATGFVQRKSGLRAPGNRPKMHRPGELQCSRLAYEK
jgi:hypothetical protein